MHSKTISNFLEISKYPRPSGNESKVRDFLVLWADSKGFDHKADMAGNLIIYVPATSDKELNETVILQSHMDMVCVKASDSNHDFSEDPIEIVEEGGYLKANDTTLGADDGIGIALSMTASDFKSHPRMELVFTTEEEVGLIGAQKLDFGLLSGKMVLNLDSEDEDQICISSAGGTRFDFKKKLEFKAPEYIQYRFEIFGMKGGHSGAEIHKNHGNSVKIIIDFLSEYDFGFELVSINGGTADNVIPSSAEAIIGIEDYERFEKEFKRYLDTVKSNLDCPDIGFTLEKQESKLEIIKDMESILNPINSTKIGVYNFSEKIPELVQTSMNLGMIDFRGDIVHIAFLARSSINIELKELVENTISTFNMSGFELMRNDSYPGWQDDPESRLVRIAKSEFENIIGDKTQIVAFHAGLECGILVAGLGEGVHAISIGPTMHDVHSINEKVEIASVEKMEKILENILKRL
ncbi:MAG: beta-Ala-His dipeptidase [Candidatus Gracilibacteria bacterium]|nr:beta-Ala-His dipeptidase [Candidatus Gracilibacteria bacterium]